MANLATQTTSRYPGLAVTYAAAAGGGDTFLPTTDTYIHIKNGGGGSITATVNSPVAIYGDVTVAGVDVTVGAGGERLIGPFPADLFADPTDGLADITYTGVTTVTLAVIQLKQP